MSKGNSHLFVGTMGSKLETFTNQKNNLSSKKNITKIKKTQVEINKKIKSWAKSIIKTMSPKEKHLFNTASIAFDKKTKKCYYGRNGGYKAIGYIKNPQLFGPKGLLPRSSYNKFPLGNCAEVDAINQALNDGAKLEDLLITTIHTTKNKFGQYKVACENCKHTFKYKISENFSGWIGEEQDDSKK